ncbi:hypothetical protein [Streptomyces sp. NPDC059452]
MGAGEHTTSGRRPQGRGMALRSARTTFATRRTGRPARRAMI